MKGFPYLLFVAAMMAHATNQESAQLDQYLAHGDEGLTSNEILQAIDQYQRGVQMIEHSKEQEVDDDSFFSLVTVISIYTNLATALSTYGREEEAVEKYQAALSIFQNEINDIVEPSVKHEATLIAAQAAFYLGMVYQDLNQPSDAIDAYTLAFQLDPGHWAAVANMGGVWHDIVRDHRQALAAYNQAFNLLTDASSQHDLTDPPPEPRFILSQLQYRIGLCISHDLTTKCILEDDPDTPVDCKEQAAYAFNLAVQYDQGNEAAKHMLASVTADATMKRASNEYVRSLFDDYAENFEHSLVQELGYTGFERLRRGFDRAFSQKPPSFDFVVDAGCGTGLVGEQFRNVSKTLLGVDLSEAILQQAVLLRPNLYDEVLVGDVIEVFRARAPISLIIAADSYIYFGDLDPLFSAMKDGLANNGYAAFTLENVSKETESALAESKLDWRWQLTASGRFAHRKEYVIHAAATHGMNVIHYEPLDGFRYEHGIAVRGHMFVLQKITDLASHHSEL
jgi:predicted TPR repeat methyltransferase